MADSAGAYPNSLGPGELATPFPARSPGDYFCRGLAAATKGQVDSPEIAALAVTLRDAAHALRDMLELGTGSVTLQMEHGRLQLKVNTSTYSFIQRIR